MLLMVKKRIRAGICHAKHRYVKKKKFVKKYDKNKPSPYIQHLGANNLYEQVTSQKLPVGGFKWKN